MGCDVYENGLPFSIYIVKSPSKKGVGALSFGHVPYIKTNTVFHWKHFLVTTDFLYKWDSSIRPALFLTSISNVPYLSLFQENANPKFYMPVQAISIQNCFDFQLIQQTILAITL